MSPLKGDLLKNILRKQFCAGAQAPALRMFLGGCLLATLGVPAGFQVCSHWWGVVSWGSRGF